MRSEHLSRKVAVSISLPLICLELISFQSRRWRNQTHRNPRKRLRIRFWVECFSFIESSVPHRSVRAWKCGSLNKWVKIFMRTVLLGLASWNLFKYSETNLKDSSEEATEICSVASNSDVNVKLSGGSKLPLVLDTVQVVLQRNIVSRESHWCPKIAPKNCTIATFSQSISWNQRASAISCWDSVVW